MDTCIRALDSGIERLKRNRLDHLLTQVSIARTFLECAMSTSDEGRRLRSLRKAASVVESVQHVADRIDLTSEQIGIVCETVATVHQQLTAFRNKNAPRFVSRPPAVVGSLLKGERVYFFTPNKEALFAGDLFRMALRLRFASRFTQDSPPPPPPPG